MHKKTLIFATAMALGITSIATPAFAFGDGVSFGHSTSESVGFSLNGVNHSYSESSGQAMKPVGKVMSEEGVTKASPESTDGTVKTPVVYTTSDGVLSLQFPQDDDNWYVIDDPNSWFAISDGKDLIAVDHLANGDKLPSIEIANTQYEEIFQMFYSTQNEVFVLTGRVADKQEASAVRNAISSFQILQYDTLQKKEPVKEPVYSVREVNQVMYCTEKDGVNVRSGYTTDDPVIGGYYRGDQVNVTGVVTKDGTDIGWFRVNYNGKTGYTASQFYSTTKPEQPTQPVTTSEYTGRTLNMTNSLTSEHITVKELTAGGWKNEATGEIFYPVEVGSEIVSMYSNNGTVLIADNYAPSVPSPTPAPAPAPVPEEEELIHDGQIFSGVQMVLYDSVTGYPVTVNELNQGGWANTNTGEIFQQEAGGGEHFYGDHGTTLVTESYYDGYDDSDDYYDVNDIDDVDDYVYEIDD